MNIFENCQITEITMFEKTKFEITMFEKTKFEIAKFEITKFILGNKV